MGYEEMMNLPIRVFWFMNSQIVRVMAEQNIRALTVANSAQSGEGAASARQNFIEELGTVVKNSPLNVERDEEGFKHLQSLSKMGIF